MSLPQAPLLIGCDVRNITREAMEILSNGEVIAINQGREAFFQMGFNEESAGVGSKH